MNTEVAPNLNLELLIFTGMRFGLMQTKVGLVFLLSKYQISVSMKTPVPLVFDPKSLLCRRWVDCGSKLERGLCNTLQYNMC